MLHFTCENSDKFIVNTFFTPVCVPTFRRYRNLDSLYAQIKKTNRKNKKKSIGVTCYTKDGCWSRVCTRFAAKLKTDRDCLYYNGSIQISSCSQMGFVLAFLPAQNHNEIALILKMNLHVKSSFGKMLALNLCLFIVFGNFPKDAVVLHNSGKCV